MVLEQGGKVGKPGDGGAGGAAIFSGSFIGPKDLSIREFRVVNGFPERRVFPWVDPSA